MTLECCLSRLATGCLQFFCHQIAKAATLITGILFAQLINIGTFGIRPWGWRLSLGLAAIPGSILLLGGIFLPDSPNSLIERGQFQKGREVLERIRGTQQVEEEYLTILAAQEVRCLQYLNMPS